MNRHQVITGAANNSESSVAIGSVENNHFTVSYSCLKCKFYRFYIACYYFYLLFDNFSKGIWIRW